MLSRWRERWLASTRGRVLTHLRRADATVNELADVLGLTDNGVRVHLAALERDGLAEAKGVRRHIGKPAVVYGITADGEAMFPKAYAVVLAAVLDALAETQDKKELERSLRALGARLAREQHAAPNATTRQRIALAEKLLRSLSGSVEVEAARQGGAMLRGHGCPLGAVVPQHPELCLLVESLLSSATGLEVRECCDRSGVPRCAFRVSKQ
jgi:predicted ArsR family transcriptional regulator